MKMRIIIALLIGIPSIGMSQSPTVNDLAWLTGRWEGTMAKGPGIADVTFAPPSGGLIPGVMRLVDNGKILVVELVSIVDTPDGPEMRFRHFSSSLEAYETNFKQAMRLKSIAGNKYLFENMVPYDKELMSTQPRVTVYERIDNNNWIGRSNIIGSDGKPAIVEVRYRRIADLKDVSQ